LQASSHGRRINLLEFAVVLKLKNNRKKFQQGNAMAANESTLRMWLNEPIVINSYLAFSFFHFSLTK